MRRYRIIIILLLLVCCVLLVTASIISYLDGGETADYSRSPISEIDSGLYEAGMGYVTSLKSDAFSRDVLYALEKGEDGSYHQLANSFTKKILALKNDSLSEDEVLFVEAVFFVCKAEYTACKTEYKARLPLTGFLHKSDAEADRVNSDEIYAMILDARTMTDIRRVHDFGREFLELTYFG